MEPGHGRSAAPRGAAARDALSALFITGASGFVGRRVLDAIAPGRYQQVIALSRSPQPPRAGVTWVQGALRDSDAWAGRLGSDTVVLHLAAATGNAGAEAHRIVNIEGTEALVRAAREAGVRGLVFVSSIAVRFPPDRHYPYADAKREAERAVAIGMVPHLIVRPTIVLGAGSPIQGKLRALAGGPVILAIGGGAATVQPIHVDDLARALLALVDRGIFNGEILEAGGPEALTMADLLRRTRVAMGKGPAPVVPVPYLPMRLALIGARAVLGRRSPVTPGQIASFVRHGTAQPSPALQALRLPLRSLDDMLRET